MILLTQLLLATFAGAVLAECAAWLVDRQPDPRALAFRKRADALDAALDRLTDAEREAHLAAGTLHEALCKIVDEDAARAVPDVDVSECPF